MIETIQLFNISRGGMNSILKLGLVIYQDCQHRYKSCALVFVVWFEFHSEESKICFWENIAWFVSRHAPLKLRKMHFP